VKLDHNTAFQTGNLITAHGEQNTGFVFTNNLVLSNEYGIIGDGTSSGSATLNKYFPEGVFKKNVIVGGRSSIYTAGNYFPATIDEARFADKAKGNYMLSQSSPYKNAATDGKNIGCDMEALRALFDAPQPARSAINTR